MSDPLDGTPGRTPVDDMPTVTSTPGADPLPGESVDVPVGVGPLDADTSSGAGSTAREAAQQGQQVAADAADQARQVAADAAEQARDVAATAADASRQVASTAAEQARQVASTAGDQARSVLSDTVSQLSNQVEDQTQRAGQALRMLSDQAVALAEGRTDEAGPLGGYAQQAADRLQTLAQRIEDGGFQGLLSDVQSFARRRPGAFLLTAAGLGFLAGRVGRSAQAVAGGSSSTPSIPQTTAYGAPATPAARPTPAIEVTPPGADLDVTTAELDPVPPVSTPRSTLPPR